MPAAKVLGGSSSINGMIFQRGNPLDYERYDPMGPGTTPSPSPLLQADGELPAADPADAYRGHSGPLILERGRPGTRLFGAFFEAVQQAGYPLTDDVNGYRQEGSPVRPQRASGAATVGGPRVPPSVSSRPNLEIRTQ